MPDLTADQGAGNAAEYRAEEVAFFRLRGCRVVTVTFLARFGDTLVDRRGGNHLCGVDHIGGAKGTAAA